MSEMGLTPKQAKCLTFIRDFMHESGGIAPTFAEIRVAIQARSSGHVHRLVTGLEHRGHIYRLPRRSRAIRLAEALELNPKTGGVTCPHCRGRFRVRLSQEQS